MDGISVITTVYIYDVYMSSAVNFWMAQQQTDWPIGQPPKKTCSAAFISLMGISLMFDEAKLTSCPAEKYSRLGSYQKAACRRQGAALL